MSADPLIPDKAQLTAAVTAVSEQAAADLVFLAGGIWDAIDYQLHSLIQKKKTRPNVVLFIATFGGSPDVAYKIGRMLQRQFQHFTAVIDAYCKSAGTLTVMGAHELVMSGRAELGPLDIQVRLPDEPKERTSGLAPIQALKILQEQATEAYIGMFETFSERLPIQTKAAVAAVDRVISALFSRIYHQLEPIRLGEYQRAMAIMTEYAKRLADGCGNSRDGTIDKLVGEYPDHNFVIDRHEACELFLRVRPPTEPEAKLLHLLDRVFASNIGRKEAFLDYFSVALKPGTHAEGDEHGKPRPRSEKKPNGAATGGRSRRRIAKKNSSEDGQPQPDPSLSPGGTT